MSASHPSTPPAAANDDTWEESSAVFEKPALAEAGQWNPSPDEVAELFTQYRPYVGKIARRILGYSADVEDIIQDVFVTTVQNIHTVREPAKFRGWLATITTRKAQRKRFRVTADTQANQNDPDEIFQICSEAPSPESTAHLAGRIQHLLDLPEQLRTPWMLRHVEGKTLEDIAVLCDCSLSTAQRRIRTVDGRLTQPPQSGR